MKELIMIQEPRVQDVQVRLSQGAQADVILFDISYTVISSNTRDNFVFPFYLNVDETSEEEGEPETYEPETVEEVVY